MSHPDEESSVECRLMCNRVYPEITLRNSCGWGQLRYSRQGMRVVSCGCNPLPDSLHGFEI